MDRNNGTRETAQLAAMARRAADLGAGAAPAAIEAKGRKQAELKLGMRCAGCEERIGVGLEFTRIDVVMKGKPTIDVQKLACCNGAAGCTFAERARGAADAMTMVEYVWLNGDPPVGADLGVEEAVAQAERAAGGCPGDDDDPPASDAEARARG